MAQVKAIRRSLSVISNTEAALHRAMSIVAGVCSAVAIVSVGMLAVVA